MRTEIRRLRRALGITPIYVTHDQEEALAISERLAVRRAGRVEQVGFPWDVYQAPRSAFAAEFIGTSHMLTTTVVGTDGEWARVDIVGWVLRARGADATAGQPVAVFRPEGVDRLPEGGDRPGATVGEAVVPSREFLGAILRYRLWLADRSLIHLDEHGPDAARLRKEGERVRFAVRPADMMLLPTEARA